MLSISDQLLDKMSANTAAICTNCMAADSSLTSAAFVPFRRHQPGQPLHKNVNSAVSPEFPAVQLAGNMQFVQQVQ